ncbi:putative cytochrome P450 CYP44 [Glandiceps talaboti]
MELTAHRIHGSGKSLFQVLGRRCQRYFRTERNVSSLQSQVINTKEDADTKRIPRPFKDIPRPKMWPVFGSLLDYTPVGPYTLEKIMEASLDRYREYGKIWVENFMGSIAVNIVDPNDAQTLYKNEGVYPIREAFKPWERAREVRKCPPGLGNMNFNIL